MLGSRFYKRSRLFSILDYIPVGKISTTNQDCPATFKRALKLN